MHSHPTKIYKKVIAIQALQSTGNQAFWTEWFILIHLDLFHSWCLNDLHLCMELVDESPRKTKAEKQR